MVPLHSQVALAGRYAQTFVLKLQFFMQQELLQSALVGTKLGESQHRLLHWPSQHDPPVQQSDVGLHVLAPQTHAPPEQTRVVPQGWQDAP